MQIQLSKWQTDVWEDTHRFRVVCAGRRSGKSMLSQLITLFWAQKEPGIYYIVSPTYKQAKSIHWEEFKKILVTLPSGSITKTNETDLSFRLSNGSTIELKGAENPDALRGVKLKGLVIDEIASIRNWGWLWSEVLRPTLTDYQAPAVFISTPKGYNHFYDLFNQGLNGIGDYRSWRFTSYDNPYILKEEIDKAKEELTEDTFAQEYMADFRKFTGLVYKGFQRELHVIKPFDIPGDWSLYRGIDFGSTNPTACLWIATDRDDNWFLIDEYYVSKEMIDHHAGVINSSPFSSRVIQTYGDPSGAQWISEFSHRGVYITPALKESSQSFEGWVRLGIERVAEKLKVIPGHYVPILGTGDRASLFVFDRCVNTINEFETYRWRERSVTQAQDLNTPEEPEKANDHLLDSLRYFAVSYSKTLSVNYSSQWRDEQWKIGK